MSTIMPGFKPHENMRIGNFSQKTMLLDYDKDEVSGLDLGDTRLIVQVSFDKDASAEIQETADKHLLSIKNLADDTQMDISNTAVSGRVATYIKTINYIRKGLLMNYCGVFQLIGSYNSGIYNTQTFGVTSIAIFTNNHPEIRGVSWKKFSTAGVHGGFFGISKYGTQNKLCIQFAGISFGSDPTHYIPFDFNDKTTEINYLAWASVKESGTNVYSLHFELWSFTDSKTDPVLVAERTFSHVIDLSTSNALNKDRYHSGIDRYLDESYSSLVFFETRFYIGAISGTNKTTIINGLLDYWRGVGIDLTYQMDYQFAQTINDLTLIGAEEYHQDRMIILQSHQLLTKTFADNSVLTRGENLNLLTIRLFLL